jgi:addiction module RelE/StbE family toxin
MREKIQIRSSSRFDRAYGKLRRRSPVLAADLEYAVELLQAGEALPDSWNDHPLTDNLTGFREFHLGGSKNTLVIYRLRKGDLFFAEIGGHEELFAHRKRREKGRPPPAPENFLDREAEDGF